MLRPTYDKKEKGRNIVMCISASLTRSWKQKSERVRLKFILSIKTRSTLFISIIRSTTNKGATNLSTSTMAMGFFMVTVIAILGVTTAKPQDVIPGEVTEKQMINCLEEADFQCIKLRALADIYKFVKTRSLDLTEGVKLEYSGEKLDAVSAREISQEGWSGFFNFIPRIMRRLSLKFNILPGGNLVLTKSQSENGLVDISVEPDSASEGREYIVDLLCIPHNTSIVIIANSLQRKQAGA